MPTTVTDPMHAFLQALPPEAQGTAKTLAQAWRGIGGDVVPGRVVTRFTMKDAQDHGFTVASLHAPHGDAEAHMEIAKPFLLQHGLDDVSWTQWSDEWVDVPGFDAGVRLPCTPLAVEPSVLVRLVNGLRDLHKTLS